MDIDEHTHEIIIVGAGPVGMHAALKAAVLNQEVLVVDKGRRFSRVTQAASIANIPGAPGISGNELLRRGREAIRAFEKMAGKTLVTFRDDTNVVDARRKDGGYALTVEHDGAREELSCRVLVLATGLVDRKPNVDDYHERGHQTLSPFVHKGEVGYCLLCEGWSLEGKRIGVIGWSPSSATIAADITRHFDGEVVLLTNGKTPGDEVLQPARDAGVGIIEETIKRLHDVEGRVEIKLANERCERFDKAFFSLGWYKVNNELACMLGARTTHDGYVVTDENSEVVGTDGRVIRGLFAVGDLRAGRWKQIVVGWGDAETAAITAYAYRLPDDA